MACSQWSVLLQDLLGSLAYFACIGTCTSAKPGQRFLDPALWMRMPMPRRMYYESGGWRDIVAVVVDVVGAS